MNQRQMILETWKSYPDTDLLGLALHWLIKQRYGSEYTKEPKNTQAAIRTMEKKNQLPSGFRVVRFDDMDKKDNIYRYDSKPIIKKIPRSTSEKSTSPRMVIIAIWD